MAEAEKIEQLYGLYGFKLAACKDEYMIFTYSNGYFHNAEIIKFTDQDGKLKKLKDDYESIGYSVRIIDYISFEKTHELLFKGFFSVSGIYDRLTRDYENFCQLQSAKLFESSYEYVEPVWNWDNGNPQENLIDSIYEQMNRPGGQLIILEAAAGYGKTCTSYELIKKIAENKESDYAPIFTELSKNRKAALFRYVLLDEIDRKFTTLSSELVISEIRNGKVPLIIDGFDELISRSNRNMSERQEVSEDDSQTMLDTIAELFEEGCATKVVLTSRKSAIFTGDIFETWASKHLSGCNVTRVSINEPTIADWIGHEKANYLQNRRIPFASIVNPILLAFMRSMSMDKFKEKCSDVENVISYYFDSLLERERERQSLRMTVAEQYEVMEQMAYNFVEYEIMAEELSFIRDLFQDIIHDNFKEYRERYISVEEKPTEEEFATKLAGHALLNRISSKKNDIGFVNDFIFGILIGDYVMKNHAILENMAGQYLEIAATAFASRKEAKREELLALILPYIRRLNYEQQLEIELKLSYTMKRDYQGHYFSNMAFNPEIYFDGEYVFRNCTFRNCVFNKCVLMTSAFDTCSFIECRFFDVIVMRDTTVNCGLTFYANCTGHEEFCQNAAYEEKLIVDYDFERHVLRKYWGSGNRFSKGRLPEMLLLRTQDPEERKGIEEALESLKKKGLMFKEGHYWFLSRERMKEIKEILEIG